MNLYERTEWKLERVRKDIKAKDLATGIGVSPAYVSAFERGVFDWDAVLIRKYKNFIDNH